MRSFRYGNLWALALMTAVVSMSSPAKPASVQQETGVRMIAVEGEGARYWPRWRGPSGQGVVPDNDAYPDTWSATENVLWQKPVPGRGHSSPVVWGDRIFITTAYDDGNRLSVLAFRRSDGSRLWETSRPRAHRKRFIRRTVMPLQRP